MKDIVFPKGFLWGSSTSAYQIEGGYKEDGKSLSIWDVFANTPGKILDGTTANVGADSYHRWKDDVKALVDMGQTAYRYSVSWSRVMPDGTGRINQKGLDYYKRLTDSLLENGITPSITLYHWDLPQILHEKGGFKTREIAKWFGEYAYNMFKEFSDKPIMWTTVNEPIETSIAYTWDGLAPGGQKDDKVFKDCQHNILLAHGEGVKAFRSVNPKGGKIGVVIDCWKCKPVRDCKEDIDLAYRQEENAYKLYLNAIFNGKYTDYILEQNRRENTMPDIHDGDMKTISTPIDFYGLNIYGRTLVSTDQNALKEAQKKEPYYYADCFDEVCEVLKNEIGVNVPIYITENGTTDVPNTRDEKNNWIDLENRRYVDGKMQDDYRISYIKDFLLRINNQIKNGMDIRGYFTWSLIDNFEWATGYLAKMGLMEIDETTKDRKRKKSADWYESVCRNNGFKTE